MKQKNYNLEIVRMISFLMVIAIHIANYYCRAYGSISSGEYYFSLLINTISRVSVPCFFMLSGALLLGRQDTIQKSLGRAKNMLLKLGVWSVAFYFFNTYVTHQTTFRISNFWYSPSEAHLWYLYVLIPIYIMLPFLQVLSNGLDEKLEKAFAILGFVWLSAVYVLSVFGKGFYYDLPILGNRSYIYYFFMGYLINKHRKLITLKAKHHLMIISMCSVIIFAVTVAVTLNSHVHYEKFLNYGNPFMILASLSFFAIFLCKKPEEFRLSEKAQNSIDNWSACSFGIYIVHIFFLDIYKMNFAPSDCIAYVTIPALVVLLAVVSFLFVKLIHSFSIGRKIL